MTPPRLGKGVGNEMLKLAGLGLKIRGLGRDDLREFMRLMLINVADVLDDELKDERLKGVVAFDTVLGAHLGPRSPNSLLLLFNRLAGETLSIARRRHGLRRRRHGQGRAGARRRNPPECQGPVRDHRE